MHTTPATPSPAAAPPDPTLAAEAAPCAHAIGFSDEQVSDWAGLERPLTTTEYLRLNEVLPKSSLPDVVNTVAFALFTVGNEATR